MSSMLTAIEKEIEELISTGKAEKAKCCGLFRCCGFFSSKTKGLKPVYVSDVLTQFKSNKNSQNANANIVAYVILLMAIKNLLDDNDLKSRIDLLFRRQEINLISMAQKYRDEIDKVKEELRSEPKEGVQTVVQRISELHFVKINSLTVLPDCIFVQESFSDDYSSEDRTPVGNFWERTQICTPIRSGGQWGLVNSAGTRGGFLSPSSPLLGSVDEGFSYSSSPPTSN